MSIILTNLTYFSYIGYIKLKKLSVLNTFFGAIVGALPLLVGIANNYSNFLVTDLTLGMTGYLFLWQFAHFYGIYVAFHNDYERTGFKFVKDKNGIVLLVGVSLVSMMAISLWLFEKYKKTN